MWTPGNRPKQDRGKQRSQDDLTDTTHPGTAAVFVAESRSSAAAGEDGRKKEASDSLFRHRPAIGAPR
jgi:hypothetical protein